MTNVRYAAWVMGMSNRQRIHLQPAYIVHQRPYRDSSVLLEIFSESHGRCALVARGVKRPKSRLRGLLQPFQPLLLSWISKSELGTLTDAELFKHPVSIKPKYLASAFYLNELLLYLLHRDDPHDELFQSYHETIDNLQKLTGDESENLLWQFYLRRFELALLQSIGYGLVLDHDVRNQSPIVSNREYDYWQDHGPVMTDGDASEISGTKVSGATLNLLSSIATHPDQNPPVDPVTRPLYQEAKRLLRTVLDYHLGSRVLHSRSLVMTASPDDQLTDKVS